MFCKFLREYCTDFAEKKNQAYLGGWSMSNDNFKQIQIKIRI